MDRSDSPRSDITDPEESDLEKEAELQRLIIQYRIGTGDRSAFAEETINQLTKDNAEIDFLMREKSELTANLKLADSIANRKNDVKNTKHLKKLGNTLTDLDQKIEDERMHHMELDSKIRDWERKLKKQKVDIGGSFGSATFDQHVKKRVRTLNRKLEFGLQAYNTTLTRNAYLRDEIDKLRSERLRYDDIHRKLYATLEKLKEDKHKITEEAVQFYDQHEEANSKTILLKDKSKKDSEIHEAEIKELQRIIHHDHRVKQFMNAKCAERPEDPQLVLWKEKQETIAEKRRQAICDSADSYEIALQRIKHLSGLTGETDLIVLVETFIAKEDQNLSLFNFVNGQNDEKEALQHLIDEINKSIELFQQETMDLEEERQCILKDLDAQRSVEAVAADHNSRLLAQVNKKTDLLITAVDSIFRRAGCDTSSMDGLLGHVNEHPSTRTLMQYLGLVEQRVNDLLAVHEYVAHRSPALGLEVSGSLLGEGPAQHVKPSVLVIPGLDDDFNAQDDSDSEEQPLTREVLREKVMHTVKKKESEARKDTFLYLTGGTKK